MTSQFEKLFLHYIMENPIQMDRVQPLFYDNKEIRFVYDIIQHEYNNSKKNIVPNVNEIYQLVRLKDPTGTKIADNVLKAVLTQDKSYRDDFVKPKFDAWVLERDLHNGIDQSIDLLRELKSNNIDDITDVADKIRDLINKVSTPSIEDMDLGLDFDDPESHNQETFATKISTGYTYLDNLMGGGFDIKTFNCLVGESSVGKCCDYNSYIYIRNKTTKQVSKIKIGDLYTDGKIL